MFNQATKKTTAQIIFDCCKLYYILTKHNGNGIFVLTYTSRDRRKSD